MQKAFSILLNHLKSFISVTLPFKLYISPSLPCALVSFCRLLGLLREAQGARKTTAGISQTPVPSFIVRDCKGLCRLKECNGNMAQWGNPITLLFHSQTSRCALSFFKGLVNHVATVSSTEMNALVGCFKAWALSSCLTPFPARESASSLPSSLHLPPSPPGAAFQLYLYGITLVGIKC